MIAVCERIVFVHREEPMRNVVDSPEPETFRALDTKGNFYFEFEQWHSMVGPWAVVAIDRLRDGRGEPYTRVWITRPH
jgi:hypothetical protein